MRLFSIAIVAVCVLEGLGGKADAAPLGVTVSVSGPEIAGSAAVGAYDLTLLFDSGIAVQSWQFGDQLHLGNPGDSLQMADDSIAGELYAGEVSFVFDLSGQLDHFTLLSIIFDVPDGNLIQAFGSIQLDQALSVIGDSLGQPLPLGVVQISSPDVPTTPVPEPSTLLLIGSGAASLIARRVRRSRP
jgi:hypothetical protein